MKLFFLQRLSKILILLLLLLMVTACQPQIVFVEVTEVVEVEVTRPILLESTIEVTREIVVTREVPVEVAVEVTRLVEPEVVPTPAAVGSPERPIQIVFLPTADPRVVEVRGGLMLEALAEATGYSYELIAPADEQAALDAICNAPRETIAILNGPTYIQAKAECEVQISHTALRFDVPYTLGMVVARNGGAIDDLTDLTGRTVAVPAQADWTTSRLLTSEWAEENIIPETIIELGSSTAALLALLDGDVDVATAVYNPPVLPREERVWAYGIDDPEIWREAQGEPRRRFGYIDVMAAPEFGGYRIRDARAALFDTHPEIFSETRIIGLSSPWPNEALVFGAEFPLVPYAAVQEALANFLNSEGCAQALCASDFYQWTGVIPADDSLYDIVRTEFETNLELEEEE